MMRERLLLNAPFERVQFQIVREERTLRMLFLLPEPASQHPTMDLPLGDGPIPIVINAAIDAAIVNKLLQPEFDRDTCVTVVDPDLPEEIQN